MKHILILILMATLAVSSVSALSLIAGYDEQLSTHATINPGDSVEYSVAAVYDPQAVQRHTQAKIFDMTYANGEFLGELFNISTTQTFWFPDPFLITDSDYGNLPGQYLIDVQASERLNGQLVVTSTLLYLTVTGNRVPHALFSFIPLDPSEDDLITFTSASFDEDGFLVSQEWFIDGVFVGEGASYSTRLAADTYQVRLLVTDDEGATATQVQTVLVTEMPNMLPVADFSWTPEVVYVQDTVTFDASASFDADGIITQYRWDFENDGNTDEVGVQTTEIFSTDGTHMVKLTVIDDEGAQGSVVKDIEVLKSQLVIDEFGCNDAVVQGELQYCSAHVSSRGHDVQGATVTVNYPDGSLFGTCMSSDKGYCHVEQFVTAQPGNLTLSALASGLHYIDSEPVFDTFRVWAQRYTIEDLKVFEDPDFSVEQDTFYRGSPMYASFAIVDQVSGQYVCDDGLVREVFLRVNNVEPVYFEELRVFRSIAFADKIVFVVNKNHACSYRYELTAIPLSDDLLGQGRVFSFVFNFSDNTAGQDSVMVNVLNNPVSFDLPESFTIMKAPDEPGSVVIDFAEFTSDLETADGDIIYEAKVDSDESYVEQVSHGVFRIVATGINDFSLFARVDDTDGSFAQDSSVIHVIMNQTQQAPVALAGPDQTVLVDEIVFFDGSASFDPDGGEIVLYSWNFGNGVTSVSTQPLASVSYGEEGLYAVVLTVTDDEGETATDDAFVTVREEIIPPSDDYISACEDGRDNDGDGLIDMDDPGCEYPGDSSEFNLRGGPENGLKIVSISSYSDAGYEKAWPGDELTIEVVLENMVDEDLEDLRVSVAVPELGVKAKSSQFTLKDGRRVTKIVHVFIPYDAQEYEYYSEIVVANDDLRRSTHRLVEVVN